MPGDTTTHTPLARAPSGIYFVGNAALDVPLWDPVSQEWVAGPLAPIIIANTAPLSTVRFVDAATPVLPALQDGSAVRPFASIAAAVASVPAGALTLYVTPGDYTAEVLAVPAALASVSVVGMQAPEGAPAVLLGAVVLDSGVVEFAATRCQLASVALDSSGAAVALALSAVQVLGSVLDLSGAPLGWTLSVQGLAEQAAAAIGGDVGSVASPCAALELVQVRVAGDVFATRLTATRATLVGDVAGVDFFGRNVAVVGTTTYATILAESCSLAAVVGNTTLTADDSVISGAVASSSVEADSTAFGNGVTATVAVDATDCAFAGDVATPALTAEGCRFSSLSGNTTAALRDCSFTANVASVTVTALSCLFAALNGNTSLTASDCTFTGAVVSTVLVARASSFLAVQTGSLTASDCTFLGAITGTPTMVVADCTFTATVTAPTVTARSSVFAALAGGTTLTCWDSTFSGTVTCQTVVARSSTFAQIAGNTLLQCWDSTFSGNVATPAGASFLVGCRFTAGAWTLGADLPCDESTFRSALATGTAFAAFVLQPAMRSGFYTSTAVGTNVLSGSTTFHTIAGSDFAQQQAGDGLALTAAACVVTYTGPTRRFRLHATLSAQITTALAAQMTGVFGLDVSGDLVGQAQTSAAAQAAAVSRVLRQPGSVTALLPQEWFFATERVVTLSSGQTVTPVWADSNLTDVTVSFLGLTVEPC